VAPKVDQDVAVMRDEIQEMKIDAMASRSEKMKTMTTWRRRATGKAMTNEAAVGYHWAQSR